MSNISDLDVIKSYQGLIKGYDEMLENRGTVIQMQREKIDDYIARIKSLETMREGGQNYQDKLRDKIDDLRLLVDKQAEAIKYLEKRLEVYEKAEQIYPKQESHSYKPTEDGTIMTPRGPASVSADRSGNVYHDGKLVSGPEFCQVCMGKCQA